MNKPLSIFVTLTFLISWSLWIVKGYFFPDSELLILVGAWGPTLSAIIVSWKFRGKKETLSMIKKLFLWRVSARYYLFAIFGIPVVGFIAVVINYLLSGNLPNLEIIVSGMGLEADDGLLILALAPVLFVINSIFGGPLAEELGWRGFAQAEFSQLFGNVLAGFVIGLIWSVWHFPLFYIMPEAVASLPILEYVILLTSTSMLFTWLHLKTNKSILLAIILHGGFNFSVGILGAEVLADQLLRITFITLIFFIASFLSYKVNKMRRAEHLSTKK